MRDAFADPKEAGVILSKYQKQISPEVAKAKPSWWASLPSVPGHKMGVIDQSRTSADDRYLAKSYPMKSPVQPLDMFVPGFVE